MVCTNCLKCFGFCVGVFICCARCIKITKYTRRCRYQLQSSHQFKPVHVFNVHHWIMQFQSHKIKGCSFVLTYLPLEILQKNALELVKPFRFTMWPINDPKAIKVRPSVLDNEYQHAWHAHVLTMIIGLHPLRKVSAKM